MNKKNFLKLSLYTFVSGMLVFIINYFFYHFVTDEGITLIWHEEPGKPFVANLIGILAVLLIFASILSLFISFIFFKEQEK